MLEERDAILEKLHINLRKAGDRMKVQANKNKKEVQYQVGDMVFLKLLQPYRMKSLAKRCKKLSPRFFGPYQITKKISEVAYQLRLPAKLLFIRFSVYHS